MDINQYTIKSRVSATHLLKLDDVAVEDIIEILHAAKDLKIKRQVGEFNRTLLNKNIALLTKHAFAKTRIVFELASSELMAHPLVMDLSGAEIETFLKDKDTANCITSYGLSAFVVDTSLPSDAFIIKDYVKNIPIINANSMDSPCSALATLLTIWEAKKSFKDLKVCLVGDFNLYDKSLVYGLIKLGADITIVAPREHAPSDELMAYCEQYGDINYTDDISFGIKNADVVYTTPHEFSAAFLVDQFAFSSAKENAMFLHPMPITRGVEVQTEIVDGPNSYIYKQAENLLHIEKAVFTLLIGKKRWVTIFTPFYHEWNTLSVGV